MTKIAGIQFTDEEVEMVKTAASFMENENPNSYYGEAPDGTPGTDVPFKGIPYHLRAIFGQPRTILYNALLGSALSAAIKPARDLTRLQNAELAAVTNALVGSMIYGVVNHNNKVRAKYQHNRPTEGEKR